jgi:hypothetical protein
VFERLEEGRAHLLPPFEFWDRAWIMMEALRYLADNIGRSATTTSREAWTTGLSIFLFYERPGLERVCMATGRDLLCVFCFFFT